MYKATTGEILCWVTEGKIQFAVLVLELLPRNTFKGVVVIDNSGDYSLGLVAEDWYLGSYTGSVNWVPGKISILE